MEKLHFWMDMIPPTVTAQEKKIHVIKGRPYLYNPPEVNKAQAKLIGHLGKYVPEKKFDGPVRLIVKWCFPITGDHYDGQYKYTKPDTDNLQKLLKDCMTCCGFWKDDALVVSEIVEKFWANRPGIFIEIQEVER